MNKCKLILGGALVLIGVHVLLHKAPHVVPPHTSAVTVQVDGRNKFERAQDSCVLIENPNKSSGSGFPVQCGPKLFVWTAAHVVSAVNETKVTQVIRSEGFKAGEIFFPAVVVARDSESDLALLWVQHAPLNYFSPIKFASNSIPRVGAPVYHAGNFLGRAFDRSVSQGIISQTGVDVPRWRTVDQANLAVIYGSSGGPLFDESENVLGVIVGLHPRIPGITFFVPVREVESFGKLHNVSWAMKGTWPATDEELKRLIKIAELVLETEEKVDACQ